MKKLIYILSFLSGAIGFVLALFYASKFIAFIACFICFFIVLHSIIKFFN